MYVTHAGLKVDEDFAGFVAELLQDLGFSQEMFWNGFADILRRFVPENRRLLAVRDEMQEQIDDWHRQRGSRPLDMGEYLRFLEQIGYLVPSPPPFQVSPANVDAEVATICGPQLVVPITNARFLLNAANARWGSLYDALYGTDALAAPIPTTGYDAERGAKVIEWGRAFLDEALPLASGSHAQVEEYRIMDGQLDPPLARPKLLAGYRGPETSPQAILFRHNGLHVELVLDREHPIGRTDRAGVADIVLESAVTTICDLEDSVATVDAADKLQAYGNWLGLMRGDLTARFEKGGETIVRALAEDRSYIAPDGSTLTLPGRSLLFVRNVGHLMTTPLILLPDGGEVPEGIVDAVITSAVALYDIGGTGRFANSREGSIYIVKPKMHGPDEVAFTNRLFDAVEDLLALPRHTIKVGVMDEERRTSASLAACLEAVKDRVVFINTGFLDRTGDEIHTSMQAGPMTRKGDMKAARWIAAYEDRNVQIGLACGLSGKGQIGKGMWAAPDRMGDMLEQKIGHPRAGASTAWVPSPTAATLHATHYHRVDVKARQRERAREPVASLEDLLTIPLGQPDSWSGEDIQRELENNAQGMLGYVVRWIDQGVGCSKVPDIEDVGLMEDRATLRISSQHMANWLLHGVASGEQVDEALRAMAAKVDRQNAGDPTYRSMLGNASSGNALQAARALIFEGARQPNGYTEPLLHRYRAKEKHAGEATASREGEPEQPEAR